MFKSYVFSLVCLCGLTALVNVKINEMANQIRVGRVYCSQKQSLNSRVNRQFNIERKRGKMDIGNHLLLVNCFMIEMLNNQQLISIDANYSTCFLKYGNLEREREGERKRKRERDESCVCITVRLS